MRRLATLLDDACAQRPHALAVAAGEARLSYRDLRVLGARLATAFADAGLAGERVATLLPNGPELLGCYLGCWGARAIAVPFEYVDAPPEIRYGLANSGARWLVVQDDKLADLDAVDLTRTRIERVFVVGAMPPARLEPFATLLDTPPRALPPVIRRRSPSSSTPPARPPYPRA
jgi:acyl-CoA synthetase (AMP-forming)/AMP-acid ligase II